MSYLKFFYYCGIYLFIKAAVKSEIQTIHSRSLNNIGENIKLRRVRLANEITEIMHNGATNNFLIFMKNNTECYEPYFFMRLSGDALLSPYQEKVSFNLYSFPYELPVNGIYHLEILFFGCNYNLSTIENVASYCILPKEELILNEPYQFNGTASLKSFNSSSWVHVGDERKNESKAVTVRYQRKICYSKPRHLQKNIEILCDEETNNTWKNNYFLKNALSYTAVDQTFSIKFPYSINVCFVGGSHSKHHRVKAKEIQMNYHVYNQVKFKNILIHNPLYWSEVTKYINNSCDFAIVAMGQWSAIKRSSDDLGHNAPGFGVNQFYNVMENAILDFDNYPTTKFYLRTIHYNPLGYKKLACPSDDFRVPYLIEGYNKALKTLSEKYFIPLIDTDWLVRPIWDSAEDYNHFLGIESYHEINYIMSYLCSFQS